AAHQPGVRVFPADRQCVVALLRRPPHGAAGGRAGRCRRHHPAAEPVEAPRRCQSGRVREAARLGSAHHGAARGAGRRCACRACAAAGRDLVSLRPLLRRGRLDDEVGADRLQRRADGHNPGEDSRAGVLCEAERHDAREDRPLHARRHPGDELGPGGAAEARRPRARHRARRLPERIVAVFVSQKTRDLFAATWLAGVRAEGRVISAGDGRAALAGDGPGGAVAAGGLAVENRDDRGDGAARHRDLWRLPVRLRLPAAPFLHARRPMTAPIDSFSELLAREDAKIELARACLQIAEDAYPGLDVDGYVGELERFAKRLRARLGINAAAEDRIIALNEFLFDDLGFGGNTDNYNDPRNSYLNEVIDRRTGIPITLSVLYMEIGRRIGLPFEGVSFPGHFLVRLPLRGGTLVLDPFSGGVPQPEAELRERLKRVIPREALGGVAVADLPLDQFL